MPGGSKKGRNAVNKPHDVFKQIDMSPPSDQCWEWKGMCRTGNRGEQRPVFSLKGEKIYAYRLVWELYNGRGLEANEVVRHSCDNTRCCNPAHLQVGVQKDNVQDMVKRERTGERHIVVKKIMHLLESGASASFVTRYVRDKYDVEYDESVVRKIRNRKIYRHIEWAWGDEREREKISRIRADDSAADS